MRSIGAPRREAAPEAPARPRSLNDLVTDRLRRAIVDGDYGLGTALSESRLAADLGTGKAPIRRAIAQLQTEGLVRVVPQSGTMVFSLTGSDVERLAECRVILESAALKLAFRRNRSRLAETLRGIVAAMKQARHDDDRRAYLALDSRFHEELLAAADNPLLGDAYRLVSAKSAALRSHLAAKALQTELSFGEHQEMASAVARGDLRLALRLLRTHLDRARTTYPAFVEDIARFDRESEYPARRAAPRR
jgi:DNA-binding GntR family transcriptional regulator